MLSVFVCGQAKIVITASGLGWVRLAPLNRFKPSSKIIFTDRSKAVFLLWIVLIVTLHVGVCCAAVSVLCSLLVTC